MKSARKSVCSKTGQLKIKQSKKDKHAVYR